MVRKISTKLKRIFDWLFAYFGEQIEVDISSFYCKNCGKVRECWLITVDPWDGEGFYCIHCNEKVYGVKEQEPTPSD